MAETQALTRPDSPGPAPPAGFPVLAVSITGILAASILLVGYYVLVIKYGFEWPRQGDTVPVQRPQQPLQLEPESRGLDGKTIRAIPIIQFHPRSNAKCSADPQDCVICLTEFEAGERLRQLPACYHAFHIDCVDAWLQSNASCPLCRSDIATAGRTEMNAFVSGDHAVVIEVRDEDCIYQTSGKPMPVLWPDTGPVEEGSMLRAKAVVSLGGDCTRTRGEEGKTNISWEPPMRRSFSVASSSGRRLCKEVQQMLSEQLQQQWHAGSHRSEGSSSAGGGSIADASPP